MIGKQIFSLILVILKTQIFRAVRVQKLNKQVSPFGGISFVNYYFDKTGLSQLIDSELGMRGNNSEYSHSDIIKNLTNVFLGGGDVVEDIST